MTRILTSKAFPPIAAISAATLALILGLEFPEDEKIIVLSSAVTFSAITCAFGGMSISMLTGLDNPLMEKLRRTRKPIIELRQVLGFAFFSGLVLAFLSIAIMFVGALNLAMVWMGMVILCLSLLTRMALIMLMIFGDPESHQATVG